MRAAHAPSSREDPMSDVSRTGPDPSFSLIQGGLFFRVERRVGLTRARAGPVLLRTLIVIGVAFLPLVLLSAAQGLLVGTAVTLPLALDMTVYARFLLAVPLLLHAERLVDARVTLAVNHFRTADLLRGQARVGFEAAIQRLVRLRDSFVPEALLLVLSFFAAWTNSRAGLGPDVSSWRLVTPGLPESLTWAGRWLELVSLPFFNFLVLRWLWRIVMWSRFLWQVSRIEGLNLLPTHPDGAGGLAFLGITHTAFGAFLVPLAASVAARGVQWVQYGGGDMDSLRNALIAFAVIALVVALGPLQVFLPRLLEVKRRGLLEYGKLATEYTGDFDRRWLREPRTEPILGTADLQSLADLANSYQVIQGMRVVPLSPRNAVTLILSAALPMLPFLLVILPLEELVKRLVQLVMR